MHILQGFIILQLLGMSIMQNCMTSSCLRCSTCLKNELWWRTLALLSKYYFKKLKQYRPYMRPVNATQHSSLLFLHLHTAQYLWIKKSTEFAGSAILIKAISNYSTFLLLCQNMCKKHSFPSAQMLVTVNLQHI